MRAGSGEGLTRREFDLLWARANGLTTQEAGERLGVTLGTARSYLASIAKKLGTRDAAHAVATAHRLGLFPPHVRGALAPARSRNRDAGDRVEAVREPQPDCARCAELEERNASLRRQLADARARAEIAAGELRKWIGAG
jgi:DNA-binding CsgD family transcriptional regulator